MTLPLKTIAIRVTPDLADAIAKLTSEVPGLTRGAILRLLLQEQLLNKSIDDQVRIVTQQLLKAPNQGDSKSPKHSRIPSTNAKNRLSG